MKLNGYERGIGMGGWLTNYKRMAVLPEKWRRDVTPGDFEHFDSYITREDVERIASWGFDHIRLGFDQLVLEDFSNPYHYRERVLARIDDFVSWCAGEGIRPMLNLHKAAGAYCDVPNENDLLTDPEKQSRFIAFWKMMANRYAGVDAAFEILNEVTASDSKQWNALAARAIAAIRSVDRDRLIVVGSAQWNSPYKLAELEVCDDPRVAYTFHFYEPFGFTHQRGVLQTANHYYNRDMPYPCGAERYREMSKFLGDDASVYDGFDTVGRDWLWHRLQPAADFAAAHPDKQIYFGEFGTIRHANIKWREAWMRDVVAFAKEHDMSYSVWNYLSTPYDGNRFSLVDDDTREFLSAELLRISLGKTE